MGSIRGMRETQMLTRAELARKAGITYQIITGVEMAFSSRMETKRKIMKVVGLKGSDWRKVFKD